jgi:nitrite reductase/ring-hydroxylating ferredoxin subunit
MSETGEMLALCATDDVNSDAPLLVEHDGMEYAVYTKDRAFYVTADQCTHGPGRMSDGYQEEDEIECPFHQGRFSFITGEPTLPPCTEALRTWTVHVVNGKVCIDPDEVRKPCVTASF